MKVLIVTPSFPPDSNGVANYCFNQAQSLLAKGVQVEVLTGNGHHMADVQESSGKLIVNRFDVRGCLNFTSPIRGRWMEVLDRIRRSDADVLICHAAQTWATDLSLLFAGSFAGLVVYSSHCISTGYMPRQTLLETLARYVAWMPYRILQRRLLLRSSGVLALADSGHDDRCADIDWFRRAGIPVGIVGTGYNPAFDSQGNQALVGASRVAAFMDGTWLKGFDLVLEAYLMSGLPASHMLHIYVHAMTAWSKGVLKSYLQRGLPVGSVIIHEGLNSDELVQEYKKAICVLSASRTECLPLVLVDCVGARVPFVALNTGHVSSIPGGIACNDIPDLAANLRAVVMNKDGTRDALLSLIDGRRDQYSWESVGDRVYNYLCSLNRGLCT